MTDFQTYRLVTKSYLQAGRDGYDVLKECEVLVRNIFSLILANNFEFETYIKADEGHNTILKLCSVFYAHLK